MGPSVFYHIYNSPYIYYIYDLRWQTLNLLNKYYVIHMDSIAYPQNMLPYVWIHAVKPLGTAGAFVMCNVICTSNPTYAYGQQI